MSQPSENPSSAPEAEARDPRIPRDIHYVNGRIGWQDNRGCGNSMPEEGYFALLELQLASAAAGPPADRSSTDDEKRRDMRIPHLVDYADGRLSWSAPSGKRYSITERSYFALWEMQHISGALRTAGKTAPGPSRDPRLREEEGSVSPCAGSDLSQSAAAPDGPLLSQGLGESGEDRGVPTQDWRARGLKHPAGRGWENDAPASAMAPFAADRFEPIRKFDIPARVRFLDALASHGEVRAAAARAGISRETAYRARRRYADFADLWDAAMVHARVRAASELATRALDGVEVPVIVRGEQVGAWRRHDARYLLAHLARLDRHVEENPNASARAARFDEMLAAMAGHAVPEEFAGAGEADGVAGVPPTREAVIAHARGEALAARIEEGGDSCEDADEREAAEDEAMGWAGEDAAEHYDLWLEETLDGLDAILEGRDAAEDEDESESEECETAETGDTGEAGEGQAEDSPAEGVPLVEYKAFMPVSTLRANRRRGVSDVSTGGVPAGGSSLRVAESRAAIQRSTLPPAIPAQPGIQSDPAQAGSPAARG